MKTHFLGCLINANSSTVTVSAFLSQSLRRCTPREQTAQSRATGYSGETPLSSRRPARKPTFFIYLQHFNGKKLHHVVGSQIFPSTTFRNVSVSQDIMHFLSVPRDDYLNFSSTAIADKEKTNQQKSATPLKTVVQIQGSQSAQSTCS